MTVDTDARTEPAGEVHPLGHRQRMIWAGQLLDRDVPLYNMAHAFTIGGDEPIDVDAFRRAFAALVASHDALRTVIDEHAGRPVQRILTEPEAVLDVVDLRAEQDPGAAAVVWADERSRRPFELGERLYDAALLLLGDRSGARAVWYLNQHHLICDAWSVALLLGRQDELYRRARDGAADDDEPDPPPSYVDFLDAEAGRVGSKGWNRARAHWRARLDEPVEPLTFYGQRPDDAGWATVRVEARIEGDRAGRLAAFLDRPELASFSPELTAMRFFHTVLAAYLHRICGVDRVVIGTPFHNRLKRAQKQTAGLFMNLYPAVVDVDDDETMTSLAAKVGAELFESMQHASHPLDAGDEAGAFEVVLNYLNAPEQTFAGHPVDDRWVHPGAGDRSHSLRLQVRRLDDGFRLFFDVKTALFDEPARRSLVDHVLRLIDGWLATADGLAPSPDDEGALPELPVGAVPLLSARELDELVVDLNRLTGPPTPTETVVDEFRRMAAERPAAVAVEDGDRRVTYRELDRRSAAVAGRLAAAGVAPGSTVGVLLPRSVDAIVAILGVLRIGAAYLPVEPPTPTARIAGMVDETGAAVVCTDDVNEPAVAAVGARPLIVVGLDVPDEPIGATSPVIGPDDTAYVIFTSGSTGRPKGVPIDHRGLANYVAWARRTYAEDQPRSFALHTSLAFDLTVTSVFVPLTSGGTIVVYGHAGGDSSDDGMPAIVDVFTDDRVDVVKATPSHLAIVRHLGLRADRLRTLIVGGEHLTTDLAAAIQDLHPDAAIHNEYGPTETVVGCMLHRYDRTADTGPSVPIGRPGANAEILLLDRRGAPVPPGVIGEIHIGGPGVAAGYLGRPEITAERFVPRPDGLPDTEAATPMLYRPGDLGRWRPGDGPPRLEFLGRTDDQVKIRGHRIELGEVEAAIGEHPSVESAAVLAVDQPAGGGGAAAVAGPVAAPVDGEVVNCERCGLPSNYPGAAFLDGVCSLCRDYDTYRDHIDAYFRTPEDLRAVTDRIRAERAGERYDCLVLLSGGKDSTYMLYQVVALGLRPLVFTLDNGYISPSALANCRRVCDDLGVDLEIAETEHMREIFRDSLDRFANVCNGCFKTIYTLSMNLARSHGIEHIVTGLARGQLFETRLSDMYDRRIFDVDRIDRFVLEARKAYHQIDDAVSEHLDVSAFVDGRIYDEIAFVDFYRYVDVGLDDVLTFLAGETPWERPDDTGRSTNCLINDVGIHVHTRERGFHNYALPYSWDVRLGHKQREAALHELDDEIDLDYVNEVMVEIGYQPKAPVAARRTTRLVGHYQAPAPIATDELRAALAVTLPDYMVPASFVHHVALPLTVNGKVDRATLARVEPGGTVGDGGAVGVPTPGPAALSDEERDRAEALRSVWAWTFDRPVGPTDNFFDLGGDSISAIQIVDRAAGAGLAVTPRQIFDAQTPLAAALVATPVEPPVGLGDSPTPLRPTDGAETDGPLPLTPTQVGMLFHTLAEPASGLYQGQIVHHLRGRVDVEVLAGCWDDLVDRHPALRTVFRWEGVDDPVQEPGSERPALVHHDWTAVDDGEARLDRLLAADRADRFDLAAASPVRVAVVATAERTVLVWSFHHIAFDGWSIALALNELLGAYQARLDGSAWSPPATEPFAAYLGWLAGRDRGAAERFWRDELAGFTSPTALPRSRPAPPTAGSGPRPYGAIERRLDPDLTGAIADFASGTRVTLSTVLQGAWGLVLARYQGDGGHGPSSGADDVVFGLTTSGRPPDLTGAESMVGMLVTTVPARVTVDGRATPDAWLRTIQDRQLAARDHEYASLVDIHSWSDLPAGQSLFDSILVVENFPDYRPPDRPDALAVASRAYRVQSNYPLSLIALPGPALTLKAVYDPDGFDADVVDRLLAHVEGALRSLAVGRAATVDDLTIVAEAERTDLTGWADGSPVAGADELVPTRIARRIAERPESVAVVGAGERLTYGELGEAADRLAADLLAVGVGPGDVVGIGADRSVELVAAIVGVHRAGAAYLPLDPGYPAERLAFMVADADVAAVVEAGDGLPSLGRIDELGARRGVGGTGLTVRSRAPGTARERAAGVDRAIEATDPAYLIYTSGSTGRPNGVLVDHGNLAWSTAARIDSYEQRPHAFLLLSSFSFDSSIVGLFWTLATGGTLVLPRPGEELDVRVLGRLIEAHSVTHTLALPSLYRLLLEHAPRRSLVTLASVIVAGEACPPALIDEHLAALPGTELHNEYGPTEASVWCTVERLVPAAGPAPSGGPVPIGRPAPGATVAVLDRTGRHAGIGVPGEIHVTGPGLTAGYHRRPELTAERFVELDGRRWFRTGDVGTVDRRGLLRFGGRVDDQVKIRGHRVELGEVEAALAAHPAVGEAVVVVTGSVESAGSTVDGGDARRPSIGTGLAAHVELAVGNPSAAPPSSPELRAWVAERLPDAFVPSAIAVTETLPRLPNGKVDRTDLPTIDASAARPAAVTGRPSTAGQRLVGDIWTDLLPGVAFGVDDDFFEIGGHSLLAVALVERLRRATGVDLPLSALLETPTVAGLAARVAPAGGGDETVAPTAAAERPGRSLIALRSDGDRVPLYLVPPAAGTALSFRAFTASTDPAQPLYCFEPVGTYGEAEPHDTVEAMAEHYLGELRAAQPDGRYRIGGSCLGAVVAWEMAGRLAEAGTPVELLVFLDPGPPHSGPGWSYRLPSQRSARQLLATTWDIVSSGQLLTAARAVWRRNSFDRIGRIHYRAQLQYVADRLRAPILWLESEELAIDRPDFLEQWRILAGDDLTPIVVPGTTHDGLMTGQPDEVRLLAGRFDEAMATFERTGRPPGP